MRTIQNNVRRTSLKNQYEFCPLWFFALFAPSPGEAFCIPSDVCINLILICRTCLHEQLPGTVRLSPPAQRFLQVVDAVLNACPGGLSNIRSVYMQPVGSSPSLPVYVDSGEVSFVRKHCFKYHHRIRSTFPQWRFFSNFFQGLNQRRGSLPTPDSLSAVESCLKNVM